MKQFSEIFSQIRMRMRKIRVYALIGESGTGKSFRAKLVAEKYNIDLVIDDGLLIRDQSILAGKSAKREKNRVTAIKRAIFEYPEITQEVIQALEKEKFKTILILGISEKMVARIVERLNLPYPDEIIYIEDVSSVEDISRARESRRNSGKHVIPVPVIEVKKDPSHHILASIKIFIKSHPFLFSKKRIVEKTVVRPHFSRRGILAITEKALTQMIMHCINEFNKEVQVKKIIIDTNSNDYILELKLRFPFGLSIPDTLAEMQKYIVTNIERFSGIHIEKLHLTVDTIG